MNSFLASAVFSCLLLQLSCAQSEGSFTLTDIPTGTITTSDAPPLSKPLYQPRHRHQDYAYSIRYRSDSGSDSDEYYDRLSLPTKGILEWIPWK